MITDRLQSSLRSIDKTPGLSLHTLLTFSPSPLLTTYKILTATAKQTGQGTRTYSDDIIKSPGVLDGAAEIQAVEGLSQCTIAVALGEFNYRGIRLGRSTAFSQHVEISRDDMRSWCETKWHDSLPPWCFLYEHKSTFPCGNLRESEKCLY